MDNRTIEEVRDNEDRLIDEIEYLEQQLEKKQDAIEKAIDYIEKFIPIDEDTILMRERQRDYLLEILKGDSNG